eukprot:TRINITY_DN8649_c0_g1_i7.p1 TRINITY_DN8649_c0_g1~~TRINITY_DN8649_c0_g1_i7.p1  ORF type:complete len:211 (+),score=42.96 TRINITY_DN8649_c0_g1_i7:60-635(+)
MALCGCVLHDGEEHSTNKERVTQFLHRSKHVIARAYCLLCGFGMHEDQAEAYRLLNSECDTSDPHVQYLLGWCYASGAGCNEDNAQAVQCYERAGNHIRALTNIADLLVRQDRPIADRRRAIALYTQAAIQGHAYAKYRLGHWYDQGIPGMLEKDIAQAKHWYSLAAKQEHFFADALQRLDDRTRIGRPIF